MIDSEFLGQRLLQQGFKDWMRYMFRIVEGRPFVVEPIHSDLFSTVQDIFTGKLLRININVPPRSAKTTLAKYLLVYALTVNPRANIIYTSFSQSLLTDIAASVRNILEHPVYKALYPSFMNYADEEVNPVDEGIRNRRFSVWFNLRCNRNKGNNRLF